MASTTAQKHCNPVFAVNNLRRRTQLLWDKEKPFRITRNGIG